MSKIKVIGFMSAGIIVFTTIFTFLMKKKAEKNTYETKELEPVRNRKMGTYEKYVKRLLDIVCGMGAIIVFSPIYIVVAIMVRLKLGSPILFTQDRPGIVDENGKETIFKMYKFRTMTDKRDEAGKLLPDELRLTKFGAWLRKTSLDELPEALNIINGTMSVIGPRPQLVKDMVFMTREQRMRHTAKPGLSGLAQVNGRNIISWEEKFEWDLKYIEKISLKNDIYIVLETVRKAIIKQEGINQEDMATGADFGDELLGEGCIDYETYMNKQKLAEDMLR